MKHYIAIVLILGLAACANHDPYAPMAANSLYQCTDGRQMVLSLADEGDYAALRYEMRDLTLPRTDERGDTHIFAKGSYALYFNADKGAALERDGVPLLSGCERV